MASSAAPGYFIPWRIDDQSLPRAQQKQFSDGALRANMPLGAALHEKEMIWPAVKGPRPLDIAVSVGTGYSSSGLSLPTWLDPGNIQEVVKAYHDSILNSEKVWLAFRNDPRKYHRNFHYRVNMQLDKQYDLDNYRAMERLQTLAKDYLDSEDKMIIEIAFQLAASLLYFEPIERIRPTHNAREYIRGYIFCRLPTNSVSALKLISRIDGIYHQNRPNQPKNREEGFRQWRIGTSRAVTRSWASIQNEAKEGRCARFAVPYAIGSNDDPSAEQCVYVNLTDSEAGNTKRLCRISGFPISYDGLRKILDTRRGLQ